jgi:hypothetical protein
MALSDGESCLMHVVYNIAGEYIENVLIRSLHQSSTNVRYLGEKRKQPTSGKIDPYAQMFDTSDI